MSKEKVSAEQYQKECLKTAKHFEDRKAELSNWGLGVAGEAGDLAGCIKKVLYHDDKQEQGIRENVGDTMWYIAMICNHFDWNLEEILAENVAKLKTRYPQGFSEKDAKRKNTRIDWMEK